MYAIAPSQATRASSAAPAAKAASAAEAAAPESISFLARPSTKRLSPSAISSPLRLRALSRAEKSAKRVSGPLMTSGRKEM